MKFECNTQDLLQCLLNATKALSARPAIQILDGVLVNATENNVSLICSDGSLTIQSSLQAMVDKNGTVVLQGKLLTEIVRKMPNDRIVFSMNENNVVTLKCANNRFTLSGLPSTNFPQMKNIENTHGYHFPQKIIKEMINRVSFAIALQESRQALTGCLFELEKSELRLVALDGFRLSLQKYNDNFILPDDEKSISAIIPGRTINELAHILMDELQETVTFHFDKTHVLIIAGNTTIVSSLLASEFINYKQILPTSWSSRITLKQKELLDAINRASLIARDHNNAIKITSVDQYIEISASSEVGDILEKVDAYLEGESITISFNSRYIGDVIKNIEEEYCTLSMNGNISPCVITPKQNLQYMYLLLPIRVY